MKTLTKPAAASTFKDGPEDFESIVISLRTLVDGNVPVRGIAIEFNQRPNTGTAEIHDSVMLDVIPANVLNQTQTRKLIADIAAYFRAKVGAV